MSDTNQASNQTEQTNQAIVANSNPLLETKEMKFRFKKDKLGNQRPSIELKLPVPSAQGIVSILTTGGKDLEFLLDVVYDTIRSVAAGIVGDDENISQETFPLDKLDWHSIATAPRAERRSIPEEQWLAFAADYMEVMPGVTGKSQEAVQNATTVFLKKCVQAKTNKPVLNKLKEQLALYVESSKNAEQFEEILQLLFSKIDTYLKSDDVQQLMANL